MRIAKINGKEGLRLSKKGKKKLLALILRKDLTETWKEQE